MHPATATSADFGETLIHLDHVSKAYEVGPARAANTSVRDLVVSHFTLAVGRRQFVSIVGPSGCGKTTVLFMLAGLREPSDGRIEVCGRTPADAVRAGLSTVIFQQPVLFEWLSAEENVLLPLRMRDARWWAWPCPP